MKAAIATMMLAVAALAATPAAGQETVNICDRTEQVRDAILEAVGTDDCAAVYASWLAGINTQLYLNGAGISTLKAGDFDGLGGLQGVYLTRNQLTSLPAGVFDGLTGLQGLDLSWNQLTSLPAGIFDNLGNLRRLGLHRNQLTSLPAGIFDNLGNLRRLSLGKNRLTTLPAGVFDNLGSLEYLDLSYNRLEGLSRDHALFAMLSDDVELHIGGQFPPDREKLIAELLPYKHQCSDVSVYIHAQHETIELPEICEALKWTEDYFHALMQTSRDEPTVRPNDIVRNGNIEMEMLIIVDEDVLDRLQFCGNCYGIDPISLIDYAIIFGMVSSTRRLEVAVHEYVHHLDTLYTGGQVYENILWFEGLATFIQHEYLRIVDGQSYRYRRHLRLEGFIGKLLAHDIPLPRASMFDNVPFLDWQDPIWTYGDVRYGWGSLFVEFLAERHHAALLALRDINLGLGVVRNSDSLVASLDDDWLQWLIQLFREIPLFPRLDSKEINLRDALYLEEGRTAVNLRNHYTGPESIDFAATSSNEEVATVEVTADGRLIVNAVSSGEIDVTVTATSTWENATQTFTIVVSADTPPWLERGFFSGWRKALLED